MVFSSYIFIAAFLPTVLLGYYILSKPRNPIYQHLFLIAASLFFYGYYNIRYLPIIIASIVINYLLAMWISRAQQFRRLLFVSGVLFNIALIGYFKYYDFFISNINALFASDFVLKHIALPLGISFFTFQQLSFLVSVYKREEIVENFIDYSLFITFFPQLVAGPIVLYSEMMPQFKDDSRRHFNAESFAKGLYLFSIGLFKKAFIADTLAVLADNGFSLPSLSLSAAWATMLSYTLQIYFDFSGYSDMAVGLGKMMNIDIPFNFFSPYKSHSISELWRRWNITLGRALSTYIYKPLGGSRRGTARTCFNLLLTFAVSGLWHGAAWTFVLWGLIHGLCTVFERLSEKQLLSRLPTALRQFFTFIVTVFALVLFRSDGMSQALVMYKGLFNFGHFGLSQLANVVGVGVVNFPNIIDYFYVIFGLGFLLFIVFRCRSSKEMYERFSLSYRTMGFAALAFSLSLLTLTRQSVFIYFNF